jgi:hypothetical protein
VALSHNRAREAVVIAFSFSRGVYDKQGKEGVKAGVTV